MKLQPKRQVNAEVATQKKAQIDEGVKLAGKIDVLRETLAKEEGNLRQFREGSVKAVRDEIDSLIVDKENLKGDIVNLERRKAEAFGSLESEWLKLGEAKNSIEKNKIELNQSKYDLDEREKVVETKENAAESKIRNASSLMQKASSSLERAELVLVGAKREAVTLKKSAQSALMKVQEKEKSIDDKEELLVRREAAADVREKEQDYRHEEQNKRDKELRDKYETLERTLKRIKHGKRTN